MSCIEIPVIDSNVKANYPFLVQIKNTENWNTLSGWLSLKPALEVAEQLRSQYPNAAVRVEHCKGGPVVLSSLPVFKQAEPNEVPTDKALWSGKAPPPEVGTKVNVTFNGLGEALITGYVVVDGYLGVMAQLDEHSRPAWHRENNPENNPAVLFGRELPGP